MRSAHSALVTAVIRACSSDGCSFVNLVCPTSEWAPCVHMGDALLPTVGVLRADILGMLRCGTLSCACSFDSAQRFFEFVRHVVDLLDHGLLALSSEWMVSMWCVFALSFMSPSMRAGGGAIVTGASMMQLNKVDLVLVAQLAAFAPGGRASPCKRSASWWGSSKAATRGGCFLDHELVCPCTARSSQAELLWLRAVDL